jgi:thiamine biosynthesis lipoprotein
VTAVEKLTFEALGGEVELFAIDPAEPLEATAEWIRGLHDQLTRFEPDSELSRFNARAGQWVEVSPVLEALLGVALYSFEVSDGLVNAAVLPSLLVAGYDRTFAEVAARRGLSLDRSPISHRNGAVPHPNDADPHRNGAIPHRNDAKTASAPRDVGRRAAAVARLPDLLQVVPGHARLAPSAAIDLGGIAKGWIADRAVERLGPNSLVSCGGDLHARGGGETGEGWPVGFGDRTLLLKDMAAATSGTSKRRWGEGLHHLIDPRTGAPSTSDLTEVSVLAETALDAEIFAKTAFLLGSSAAEDYLRPRSKGWVLS